MDYQQLLFINFIPWCPTTTYATRRFDAINEWIKEILIGAINGNLSTMFGDVNEKVGTIAAEVGQTPQGWNANIFSMIQTLSENVIVPIAGLVITYVLCYEFISMVSVI